MVDVGTPIITIQTSAGSRRAPAARSSPAPRPRLRRLQPRPGLSAARPRRPHAASGRGRPAQRTAPAGGRPPQRTRPARCRSRMVPDGATHAAATTAPDARHQAGPDGGLEVGRQAEAHALDRAAAPSAADADTTAARLRTLAKPPARKYAKRLGVDLTTPKGGDAGDHRC